VHLQEERPVEGQGKQQEKGKYLREESTDLRTCKKRTAWVLAMDWGVDMVAVLSCQLNPALSRTAWIGIGHESI
jgi:hypothetical protein